MGVKFVSPPRPQGAVLHSSGGLQHHGGETYLHGVWAGVTTSSSRCRSIDCVCWNSTWTGRILFYIKLLAETLKLHYTGCYNLESEASSLILNLCGGMLNYVSVCYLIKIVVIYVDNNHIFLNFSMTAVLGFKSIIRSTKMP